MLNLTEVLAQYTGQFSPVIPNLDQVNRCRLDFSAENPELNGVDVTDPDALGDVIRRIVVDEGAHVAVGGYGENRSVYESELFKGEGEARTLHLGVDIWVPAGTPVLAPLDGSVHSIQDNHMPLDYGPTIILEHELDGAIFYTLYGHLGRHCLFQLERGHVVPIGHPFAVVGGDSENGGWPPHLHFQIISDMMDFRGDFPGVARASDARRWLNHCPDPNLILGLPELAD